MSRESLRKLEGLDAFLESTDTTREHWDGFEHIVTYTIRKDDGRIEVTYADEADERYHGWFYKIIDEGGQRCFKVGTLDELKEGIHLWLEEEGDAQNASEDLEGQTDIFDFI